MARDWKLVIDTQDAGRLAEFWAAALEYEIEDPGVLIRQLLAAGHLAEDAVSRHGEQVRFRGLSAIRHPDDPFDPTSGIGHGRRILFQDVPEAKTTKNRLHIDVHSAGGLDLLLTRLESLGANRIQEMDQGPAGHWWILRDPEGNEFCAS